MVPSFEVPRPLGVGFPYVPSLPAELYRPGGLLDFVELTPETLCRERRDGGRRTLDLSPELLAEAWRVCGGLPAVVHGVELSIGSAHAWNEAYLEMLDRLYGAWPFRWHSEHLGFQTFADPLRGCTDVGVPLPLPLTGEAARLVSERARGLLRRYPVPFLLENPAHYLPELPADEDLPDEAAFMSRIVRASGCGQLLDLFNLYCNSVNHGFDAFRAVERFPLESVIEIHVAGGAVHDGFLMDSHSARVPEPVWELLEFTLARARHVAGVVYEILEATALGLGPHEIAADLQRARDVWRRWACAPAAERT